MLPSPSALRHHDIDQPIIPFAPHYKRCQPSSRNPFAPTSRINFGQQNCRTTEPSIPLTSLVLSLPLAQKIHNLILTSRQMEIIARGLSAGTLRPDVEQHMEGIEDTYNLLRDEVEYELESAWVNAGLLPAQLPSFPSTVKFQKSYDVLAERNDTRAYTVDRDLKRKRDAEDGRQYRFGTGRTIDHVEKKQKPNAVEVEDESRWTAPVLLQPIGLPKTSIPLANKEKTRLKSWEFESAWRCMKGNDANVDGQVSPKRLAFATTSALAGLNCT